MDNSNWELTEKGLFRSLRFESFTALTQFLAQLGPVADALDHHPDCVIRKAVILDVHLLTHDQKKVTEKDYGLATEIDRINMLTTSS
jgi:4a-hydroxytetrahydrobiopterin dehydratase